VSNTLAPEKPHRLSQGRILEMLLARNVGASESVTLRLNAKGETQPEVTAVVLEGETLSDAADRAQQVYDRLREHFAAATVPDNGTPFD
jgi:hypothetical protein